MSNEVAATEVVIDNDKNKDMLLGYILVAIIIILTLILLVRILSANKPKSLKGPVVIDSHRTKHIEVKELAEHLQNRKEKLKGALGGQLSIALYKPQLEKITKNLKKFIDQIPESDIKTELYEQLLVDIHSQEGSLEYEDNKKTGRESLNEVIGHIDMIQKALVRGCIDKGFLDISPMTDLLILLEEEIENQKIEAKKKAAYKPEEKISLTGAKVFNGKKFGDSKETENHHKIKNDFNRGDSNVIGSMEYENFD